MTCGTCQHGKHMTAHGRSLGWVACKQVDESKFYPESRACVTGKFKEATSSAPQAGRIVSPPPRQPDLLADAEQQWWNATGN